jgi:hypothetical protein
MCLALRNVFTIHFNVNLKTSLHKGAIYMQATEKLKNTDSFIVYFIKNTYK